MKFCGGFYEIMYGEDTDRVCNTIRNKLFKSDE